MFISAQNLCWITIGNRIVSGLIYTRYGNTSNRGRLGYDLVTAWITSIVILTRLTARESKNGTIFFYKKKEWNYITNTARANSRDVFKCQYRIDRYKQAGGRQTTATRAALGMSVIAQPNIGSSQPQLWCEKQCLLWMNHQAAPSKRTKVITRIPRGAQGL
jgi:hypothetical protein